MSRLLVVGLLAATVVAASCGSSDSETRSAGEMASPATGERPAEDCAAAVARMRADWEKILARGALEDPNTRFANLSPAEFDARIDELADDYGFGVVEVAWLEPLQAAPAIVLEWNESDVLDEPRAFERDLDAIVRVLNPHDAQAELPWEGRAFEGFFLEARDADGVPFLAFSHHWRGSDRGGGRWTRFGELVLRPPPVDLADLDIRCL